MKIFLGFILLGGCAFLGYLFSVEYTDRKKFYQNLYEFNNKMKNAVSFSKQSIVSIIGEYKDCEFKRTLKSFLIDNDKQIFCKNLKKEDCEFINSYFSVIGNVNDNTQIDYINGKEIEIKTMLEQKQVEEKKYRLLYLKMGILIGLIAFIIIM